MNVLTVLLTIVCVACAVQRGIEWWQAEQTVDVTPIAVVSPPAAWAAPLPPSTILQSSNAVADMDPKIRLFGKIAQAQFCGTNEVCAIIIDATEITVRPGQKTHAEFCERASGCTFDIDVRNIHLHSQPGSIVYAEVRCARTTAGHCTVPADSTHYAKASRLLRFSGDVEAIDNGCHADGACVLTVSGKAVATSAGRTLAPRLPWGSADLVAIGDHVDVYCRETNANTCSLEGAADFQVSANPWTRVDDAEQRLLEVGKAGAFWKANYKPYVLYRLAEQQTQRILAQAQKANPQETKMKLPMPDGSMRTFRFITDSVMAPELQALHPEIETFALREIGNVAGLGGASLTALGLDVWISSADTAIVAYDRGTGDSAHHGYYVVYRGRDYIGPVRSAACGVTTGAAGYQDLAAASKAPPAASCSVR